MSCDRLSFSSGSLDWFKIEKENEKFKITLVDGRNFTLDRNQADLLRLYLTEHLNPTTISKGLDDAITDELKNEPKSIMGRGE